MTNAERQRRYRDKKRGGPPVGRWANYVTAGAFAKQKGVGRTKVFMWRWICKIAPDLESLLETGALKVTPTYTWQLPELIQSLSQLPHGACIEFAYDRVNERTLTAKMDGEQLVFYWKAFTETTRLLLEDF